MRAFYILLIILTLTLSVHCTGRKSEYAPEPIESGEVVESFSFPYSVAVTNNGHALVTGEAWYWDRVTEKPVGNRAVIYDYSIDGTYENECFFDYPDKLVKPQVIASDNTGNIILGGYFSPDNAQGNEMDGFIAKLAPGGEVIWDRTIVSETGKPEKSTHPRNYEVEQYTRIQSEISEIVVDSKGGIFVAGRVGGNVIFSTGKESPGMPANMGPGVLVAKYNPDGSIGWIDFLHADYVNGIAIDDFRGCIYVSGRMYDELHIDKYNDPTSALVNYVAKYNINGDRIWIRLCVAGSYIGGGVAVDKEGSVYVGSSFTGSFDFDPGPGEDVHSACSAFKDAFLVKYRDTGEFCWVQTWGDSRPDLVHTLSVDSKGEIYVAGLCNKVNTSNSAANDDSQSGKAITSFFIKKFNSDGSIQQDLEWTPTGPETACIFFDMTTDNHDAVYFTGNTSPITFDPEKGLAGNAVGPFLCKLDSNGNFQWSVSF